MSSIKVSAQTASLTLGGNSNEDDESIFTLHDRDSSQNSIISANDTIFQTKGKIGWSNKKGSLNWVFLLSKYQWCHALLG